MLLQESGLTVGLLGLFLWQRILTSVRRDSVAGLAGPLTNTKEGQFE
jgi:hypothetical protein